MVQETVFLSMNLSPLRKNAAFESQYQSLVLLGRPDFKNWIPMGHFGPTATTLYRWTGSGRSDLGIWIPSGQDPSPLLASIIPL